MTFPQRISPSGPVGAGGGCCRFKGCSPCTEVVTLESSGDVANAFFMPASYFEDDPMNVDLPADFAPGDYLRITTALHAYYDEDSDPLPSTGTFTALPAISPDGGTTWHYLSNPTFFGAVSMERWELQAGVEYEPLVSASFTALLDPASLLTISDIVKVRLLTSIAASNGANFTFDGGSSLTVEWVSADCVGAPSPAPELTLFPSENIIAPPLI